jgi:hypothetical protein
MTILTDCTNEYKPRPLIYVAGPINGDACQYIVNVGNMLCTAEWIRGLGASVCVPCNDFLSGLISGELKYEDYVQNSMDLMIHCDAVYFMDYDESSKGCCGEYNEAVKRDVKIFTNIDELERWLG